MPSIILQHASGPYLPVLDWASERHAAYAAAHGMDYLAVRDGPAHPKGVMWERYDLIRAALGEGFGFVCYLDADAVIVDTQIDLRAAMPWYDESQWLGMGHEGHWFQAGVQYIRNGPQARAFFDCLCEFFDDRNDEVSMNDCIRRLPLGLGVFGLHPAWHSIQCKGHREDCIIRAFHNEGNPENRLRLMQDIVARRGL